MKSKFHPLYYIVMALLAMAIVPSLFAQMGQGKGRGMGGSMYDPTTVVTVKGTVQDVQEDQQGQKGPGWGMGTHLVIKTDKETLTVLVGPSSFLKAKNFSFAKGDQIEVTGSKVQFRGSDAIIAREIKRGNDVLTLRDEKGIPVWSGRNRS